MHHEPGLATAATRRLPAQALAGLREAFADELLAERLPRLQAVAHDGPDVLPEQALRDAHSLASSAAMMDEADAARAARATDAADLAEQAARVLPLHAPAHRLRGAALVALGRDDRTLVSLRKALLLDLRGVGRESRGGDVLVLAGSLTEVSGGALVGVAVDEVRAVVSAGGLHPAGSGEAGVLPSYVVQVLRGDEGVVFLVDLEQMVQAMQAGPHAVPQT